MNKIICNALFRVTFITLIGVGLTTSCISSGAKGDSSVDQVKAYLEKNKVNNKQPKGFAAYFDFSDGMQHAYADTETKEVLQGIVQKVTTHSDEFIKYSLADNKITELPSDMTDLYNTIMNNGSYNHQNAPIQKTLEKIVKDGKSALVITDFEEYTGVMQKAAFATPSFNDWLKVGNDITFFVTDYKENNKDKHLYYIVFDTNEHKLLSMIEDGVNGKPKNYKRFLLSTTSYKLETDYLSETKGGNYHDASGVDNVSAVLENGDGESFCRFEEFNAEFYPLGETWENINSNAKSLQEEGVESADRFNHLLSKLYLDLGNMDSYLIKGLDIRVTDVENDFTSYVNNQFALKQKGTENELDYFDEKGKLLPEFEYKSASPSEIKDMLIFDKHVFEKDMKSNPEKVELAINFHPNFNGSIIGAGPTDMLRVDIYITDCEPNYEKIPELFEWTGNENLSYSVKNTLQDMRPVGRIIYSYFMKGLQQ